MSDSTADRVKNIASEMLHDEVTDMVAGDADDWQSMTVFEVDDRVYLRCAFYKHPDVGDYVWEIQDQTSVEIDITDAPVPEHGGNAVVECDVVDRVNAETVRLGNPKIVDLNIADATIEELGERL